MASPFETFAHAYGRGDADIEAYVLAAVPKAVALGGIIGTLLFLGGK